MLIPVNNVRTQNLPALKNKYFNMTELAFKVKITGADEFKLNPVADEKFYTVKMPADKPHQWIHYHISHIDTASHHLSIYQPERARIIIAAYADTFISLYELNKWDTIYTCEQNPPSHTFFTFFFPVVECFYPADIHNRAYNFKDHGKSYFIKTRHPYTGRNLSIWINKINGLVDSIYSYSGKNATDKLYFEYYYTRNSEGVTHYKVLPEFYPIDSFNREAMKYVDVPHPKKAVADTQAILNATKDHPGFFLLDFWFIGCRPCHSGFPVIEKLRRDFPDSMLKIVAYNVCDKAEEIEYFKKKKRIGFDMEYDSLGLNSYFSVRAYPTTILLNHRGEILYRHEGLSDTLDKDLLKILDEQMRK